MVCRHIGLLFGTRLYRHDFPASSDLPSTRYRICLQISFFHSRERIRKHPDSLDASVDGSPVQEKNCGFKNIRIRVDRA